VADVIAGADSRLLQVGLILAAVVLAPVTEELMFRGVLLRALEPRGKRFALVVSALVFSVVHVLGLDVDMLWQSAVVVLPPIFLLGLVLGWLTQRSGRLGPAIFLHSGWNLLAAFVLLLPPEFLEQVS
jgi:membrane protease YdiL (CAAX protease family)